MQSHLIKLLYLTPKWQLLVHNDESQLSAWYAKGGNILSMQAIWMERLCF